MERQMSTDIPAPDRPCVRWFFSVPVGVQHVRALNMGLWSGLGLTFEARLSEADPKSVEVFSDDDSVEALLTASEWYAASGWRRT